MDIPEEGISDRIRERIYGGRYESNVMNTTTPHLFFTTSRWINIIKDTGL